MRRIGPFGARNWALVSPRFQILWHRRATTVNVYDGRKEREKAQSGATALEM